MHRLIDYFGLSISRSHADVITALAKNGAKLDVKDKVKNKPYCVYHMLRQYLSSFVLHSYRKPI